MLEPLNPRSLNALVCDGDEGDSKYVPMAKRQLNKRRDLPNGGIQRLKYGEPPALDPPFSDLRIHSTSVEGVIEIRVRNKPFLSIRIFDHPQNWQAMLIWLWEYGDKYQIARFIPKMDLRRINALVSGNDGANSGSTLGIDGLAAGDVEGDGHLFDVLLGIVKRTIATKGIGEGVYQLLLAFNTFEPGLCWDTSSTRLADGGYEKWFISFRNSPYRSLRLQPSSSVGDVDLYAFKERMIHFNPTPESETWQWVLLRLWDYGRERLIAKAKYEASGAQPNPKAKSQSKQRQAQKPLLHQVLHKTSLKAQRGHKLKPMYLSNPMEEADIVMNNGGDGVPMQRRALQSSDPNGQVGKSGHTRSAKCLDRDCQS